MAFELKQADKQNFFFLSPNHYRIEQSPKIELRKKTDKSEKQNEMIKRLSTPTEVGQSDKSDKQSALLKRLSTPTVAGKRFLINQL